MSISSIASGLSQFPLSGTQAGSPFGQARQDFQALGSALQSGNLSAAQTAFSQLQQLQPPGGQAPSGSPPLTAVGASNPTNGAGSVASLFSTLGSDLQSGNLSAAQNDFSSIMSQIQAHHHGHGHHGGETSQAAGSASTGNNAGTGTLIQDLLTTSSSSAASSGSATASTVQTAFLQLVQSLQSTPNTPGSSASSISTFV